MLVELEKKFLYAKITNLAIRWPLMMEADGPKNMPSL